MKHIFISIIIYFITLSCFAETKEREATKSDLKIAAATLKKLGIDESKVKYDMRSLSWQQVCWSSEVGGNDPLILSFSVAVISPIKVKGLELGPKTNIFICDEKVTGIIGSSENNYSVSGYLCTQVVGYSADGALCECRLGKDTKVNGVTISKGTTLFLPEGKNPIILVPAEAEKPDRPRGFYEIKDGKAVKSLLDGYACGQ